MPCHSQFSSLIPRNPFDRDECFWDAFSCFHAPSSRQHPVLLRPFVLLLFHARCSGESCVYWFKGIVCTHTHDIYTDVFGRGIELA